MIFSIEQSTTDPYAIACNSGKLNAIAKNSAYHYRKRLGLSAGTSNENLFFS